MRASTDDGRVGAHHHAAMTITLKQPALALVATAALVIGSAAPASALVTVSGDEVSSDAAGDLVRPYCNAGSLGATGTATTGAPCVGIGNLRVFANAGADTVDLTQVVPADFPALRTVDVYLGDDFVADSATGSPFNDSFIGGVGDSASGGAGDDTFDGVYTAIGGAGDDVFLEAYEYAAGGPGDDRFIQFTASAGIEGGDGFDTWEADFDQSSAGALGSAGVSFTMTSIDLTVSAPGISQTVPITGIEHVEIGLLRGVDDTWQGAALPASQDVRAFSGNDTVTGGPLDDFLAGGIGNDTLVGGAGRDTLHGGPGDDTIQARDGEVDTISCGDGTDTVVADAGDVVSGCEVVQLPAVAPPPPAAPETSAIKGKKKVAKPAKATFRFSSPTAGASFQCKVDKGRWKSCSSPYKVATKKLKAGKHTLRVRAVLAGVVDPTPSVRKFKVTT